MTAVLFLSIVLTAFVILDILATQFGVDSREDFGR